MVEGLEKLRARFRALPRAVQEAATQTLEQNANEIVAMMRRLVPKDSGRLAASIGWTWGDAPEGSISVGSVAGSPDSERRITIYAGSAQTMVTNSRGMKFQLAKLQEFGTKKMPANPFFYHAIRVKRKEGRKRMSARISRAAKKAFNG
ncbi:HK97-gp10 family putative phage morphogenesis protein [Haematobacter genomosp. 1]|uniref:HK97 gp10 family phage protein n=1 Tax=Haematobacter genomosp. 1 TaxID=366618 RepID=A0A212ABY4_9RHOB|nr:HK97-gp10 family putative phage morphogenesis protein [Haematobacter genomosp. 1]OWJ78419.1 hypothetical protein CDV49_08260 [Haematobacter genomosp. 1]